MYLGKRVPSGNSMAPSVLPKTKPLFLRSVPEEALKQVGAVVEGYYATRAVHELVRDKGIDMPICDAMYQLLFEGAPLEHIVNMLITRGKKPEDDR